MIVCIVCIVCITLNARDIKFCMNVQINCIEFITETEYICENVDKGNFVKIFMTRNINSLMLQMNYVG